MAEEWEGDDYGEELPVAGPETEDHPRRRRRRPRIAEEPARGTPLAEVPSVAATTLAQATGKLAPEPDEWRVLLGDKQRDKAIGALTSTRPTHGSGRGFGLAE